MALIVSHTFNWTGINDNGPHFLGEACVTGGPLPSSYAVAFWAACDFGPIGENLLMAAWSVVDLRSPVQAPEPPLDCHVVCTVHHPGTPEYQRLIEVLMTLRCRPDRMGETTLNKQEAATIRASGFEARAGWKPPWRCPLLPHALVWPYPALWHLSDEADRLWQPRHLGWARTRARPIQQIAPMDPLSKLDQRFLRILRAGPLRRREMQRRLWRIPATIFNAALSRLVGEGWIKVRDGRLALASSDRRLQI